MTGPVSLVNLFEVFWGEITSLARSLSLSLFAPLPSSQVVFFASASVRSQAAVIPHILCFAAVLTGCQPKER